MSFDDKLKEAVEWLQNMGLRKEAIELLNLLSKNAGDDDIAATIRKLRIERARMMVLTKKHQKK